jgi:enolase
MGFVRLVLEANQRVLLSHCSGETNRSVIVVQALAIGARYIDTGSTAGGERIQKYTKSMTDSLNIKRLDH